MKLTLFGIVMLVKLEHPEKQALGILLIEVDSVTLFNALQPSKIDILSEVTLFGMVKLSRPELVNA